jgi:hypothetical protein
VPPDCHGYDLVIDNPGHLPSPVGSGVMELPFLLTLPVMTRRSDPDDAL